MYFNTTVKETQYKIKKELIERKWTTAVKMTFFFICIRHVGCKTPAESYCGARKLEPSWKLPALFNTDVPESNHLLRRALLMFVFFSSSSSGHAPGQLYTYPARCWRKKRRLNILEDPRLVPIEFKIGEPGHFKCVSCFMFRTLHLGILKEQDK